MPPGEEPPVWLSLVPISLEGGTAVVELVADGTQVPPGAHQTVLRFFVGEDGAPVGAATDLQVAFTVWESFALSAPALELSTTLDGGANPSVELGILGAQSQWRVGTTPAWLAFDRTGGDGRSVVRVSCDKSAIAAPGVSAAEVPITDTVGGRVLTLPVRCIASPHRLLLSQHGLAFSQFADAARLAADVAIEQNGDTAIPWSASATPAWLSVTASEQTGQALHVTADATGLAAGLHYGEITIGSDASTISRPEKIRVGLYVSAGSLPQTWGLPAHLGDVNFGDPIRPYVYVLNRNQVQARNIYTGVVEKTYTVPVPGPYLEVSDVSDDGNDLFVVVRAQDPSKLYFPREIYRVHLDNEAEVPTLLFTEHDTKFGDAAGAYPVKYFRHRGVPMLFNPIGRLHRADTGEVLTSFQWNFVTTDNGWLPVYRLTRVSIDRRGEHIALTNVQVQPGDKIKLYGVRVHDVAGVPAELRLESEYTYQNPVLEPGAMLLGAELDRIYTRGGYLEKSGTSWVYRPKFTTEHQFVNAGPGVLFGAGAGTVLDTFAVGEYNKDGDRLRSLSGNVSQSRRLPWLSSDGLAVLATFSGGNGGQAMSGFRR